MCRLQAIAGSPELYPELIRLGGLPHILALLSHDNSDIAASAIQLLRELTDADAIEDSVRPSCLGLTSIRTATSHSSHLADALSQHPCKIVGGVAVCFSGHADRCCSWARIWHVYGDI